MHGKLEESQVKRHGWEEVDSDGELTTPRKRKLINIRQSIWALHEGGTQKTSQSRSVWWLWQVLVDGQPSAVQDLERPDGQGGLGLPLPIVYILQTKAN